jgi:integrase
MGKSGPAPMQGRNAFGRKSSGQGPFRCRRVQYLAAAQKLGESIDAAYFRALNGIRAKRGEQPIEPQDPFALRDLATLLLDCALRPDEAFRLSFQEVQGGTLQILYGKTKSARRTVPASPRVAAILDMRKMRLENGWVFPAPTRSGHIEKSSLKKQHRRGLQSGEDRSVYVVHVSPHLLDEVGASHGPVHARLLGRTQRFWDDTPICVSSDGNRTRLNATRTGCAE